MEDDKGYMNNAPSVAPFPKPVKRAMSYLRYMEGLGMYVIMIIDFGVFGNNRCALHDPDGIVVVSIMNVNQCCHIEVHPCSLFKNLVSCRAQLQPAQLVLGPMRRKSE